MNILETIAATVQYRNAARLLPPFSASEDGRTLHCGAISTALLPADWQDKPVGDLIPIIETSFVRLTVKALSHGAHKSAEAA